MSSAPDSTSLSRLTQLVARLRAPDGCPWDREQELPNLRAYFIEEAHEAAAAIDSGDWKEIAAELGDVLFQVAFVTRLGEEAGAITLTEVIDGIEQKMIDRHPHVFGDVEVEDSTEVRRNWERNKARRATGSVLAGMPETLPALLLAYRMTQKASGVGFDWAQSSEVMAKLLEEVGELERELERPIIDTASVEDELGDVLFTVANLARHLSMDPEAALVRANRKFRRRFERVQELMEADGHALSNADEATLDDYWRRVKREERRASS